MNACERDTARRARRTVLGAVAVLFSLAAPAGADVSSRFDTSSEGWDPGTYQPSGGNPGGYLAFTANANDGPTYSSPPIDVLFKDFRPSIGRLLTFDYRLQGVAPDGSHRPLVRLGGNNGGPPNEFVNYDATMLGGGPEWQHLEVPLGPGPGWTVEDGNPQTHGDLERPATQADFVAVMTNLVTLQIRAEQAPAVGTIGLDNVIIPTAPPLPIARPLPPVGSPPPAGVAPPVFGKSVVLSLVSGVVLVRSPGSGFVRLKADRRVALGTEINATRGRVALKSARSRGGETQTAVLYDGRFTVHQRTAAGGLTELRLSGPAPRCGGSARARRTRRLRGNVDGLFRTRGQGGTATARRARWSTEDRCGGTRFRVQRGRVDVRDFKRGKTIRLRAGGEYVARTRRP